MSKISLLAAIVIGLAVSLSTASAQGGGGGGGGGGRGGRGGGMAGLTNAATRLAAIDTAVTLTADEKPKVQAALDTEIKALIDLRADTTVQPADMRTKQTTITDAFSAKMKEILTADQYTKFQAMPAPGRGGRGGRGGGGAGGAAPGN